MRTVDNGGRCALRVCGQLLLARLEEKMDVLCSSMVHLRQMDRQQTVLRRKESKWTTVETVHHGRPGIRTRAIWGAAVRILGVHGPQSTLAGHFLRFKAGQADVIRFPD